MSRQTNQQSSLDRSFQFRQHVNEPTPPSKKLSRIQCSPQPQNGTGNLKLGNASIVGQHSKKLWLAIILSQQLARFYLFNTETGTRQTYNATYGNGLIHNSNGQPNFKQEMFKT
jgi:hypothetical protein